LPAAVDVRENGYAQIGDYAVIGDGRTAALVAQDGSIDWLCLPDFDSPSVFGAILDAEGGGAFSFRPVERFEAERAYLEGSNVLATTFRTETGTVRLLDAITLSPAGQLAPMRELVRRVECIDGFVEVEWAVEPRFDYGRTRGRTVQRAGRTMFTHGSSALTLSVWGAEQGASGRARVAAGESVLFSLASAHHQPALLPGRADTEERLEHTRAFWRRWSGQAQYDGPWRDQVLRSALVLKLLVFAPSGAIVAAPTTSLPEQIGGGRNWDYRYAWIRDATYALDALFNLGYHDEAHAFFWWLMHASRLTQPRMQVLYGIDGGGGSREEELGHLSGHRGSAPVRVGNAAGTQLQLDLYGSVFNSIWLHARSHGDLGAETGRGTAKIADFVTKTWREPDSGIWEIRSRPRHFVHSKAMCWAALDRACRLAEADMIPDRRDRWRAAAGEIRNWVETEGWDEDLRAYIRASDLRELDASILTLPLVEYAGDRSRLDSTIDAVRSRLGSGPLLYRYLGEDGVPGDEGAFTTCSFWLVDALARLGRVDEAADLMDELVPLANDVGLFAEEIDPSTGEQLGNFPQALVHLALVNAAFSIEQAGKRS
jgi:GH15 family glucan-1,4-alpha-glucosidase